MSDLIVLSTELKTKPKLWTPKVLADYLGVPVSWIYKRTRKNGPELIPHIKLGKYIRFDPESMTFQGWLNRHEAKPQSAMHQQNSAASNQVTAPV